MSVRGKTHLGIVMVALICDQRDRVLSTEPGPSEAFSKYQSTDLSSVLGEKDL